ncbi:hypothetical protein FRC17_004559 [Serendipita sp. 399]|nr:hypothetical protein FRC17_004559 [Serendipita sp. 399]
MSVAIDKNNDSDEGMLVREASQHPTNSDTRPDNATLEAVDQVPVVHNHKAAPGVEGGNAASAPFSAIDIPGNHSILNDPPIPKHDTVAPEEDELKGRQRTESDILEGVDPLMVNIFHVQVMIMMKNASEAAQQSILRGLQTIHPTGQMTQVHLLHILHPSQHLCAPQASYHQDLQTIESP